MVHILRILLLLSLLAVPAFAVDYTQDANCMGAWLFTEGSGESVADASGEGNTGTFLGAGEPAWDGGEVPAAYVDYSTDYDGANDIIYKGDTASLSITGDFTIVTWSLADTSAEVKGMVCKWGDSDPARSYLLGKLSTNELFIQVSDGTGNTFKSGSVQMTDGVWYHNAAVYVSGGTPTGELFVNGASDGGAQGITRQSIADNASTFVIGAIVNTNPTSTPPNVINEFDGHMTEVAIFDRTLDGTELTDIMDNGLAPSAGSISQLIMVTCD